MSMPDLQVTQAAASSRPRSVVETAVYMISVSVGFSAVLIALAVCYEILMRSVVGRPVIWVEEVTAYLVGYITFIGMGAGLYQGAHVSIDFLVDRLNGPALAILKQVDNLLMLGIGGLLFILSWTLWSDAWTSGEQSTSLLSVPLWIPYFCFLIGSAIFVLVQLVLTVTGLVGSRNTQPGYRVPGA